MAVFTKSTIQQHVEAVPSNNDNIDTNTKQALESSASGPFIHMIHDAVPSTTKTNGNDESGGLSTSDKITVSTAIIFGVPGTIATIITVWLTTKMWRRAQRGCFARLFS
ncbi:hypothetical protein F5B20DRAFT_542205 [Whalleya microplaca]|nr:hypothetical protein F5B20DRAFT_542205 [Whalleya microplaca]